MLRKTYTLYRTMQAGEDGAPLVGRGFAMLGVRIGGPRPDIRILDDGTVAPETGGMSVFTDPRKMPKSLRPRTLADKPGESGYPCYKLEEARLLPTLCMRKDKGAHALVEPRDRCMLEEYESALHATRPGWEVAHAAPK